MKNYDKLILVINPGSTSTKVALYNNDVEMVTKIIDHTTDELNKFGDINSQLPLRKKAVYDYLDEQNINISKLSAVAARGGAVGKLESGAYEVTQKMVNAAYNSDVPHASNLACMIAFEIAQKANIKAYIYDAISSCGMPDEIYTITGLPELEKVFYSHVLNVRAVSIKQAQLDNALFEEQTYIVAHMGGGITVTIVDKGEILDVVSDDEGAFSPERSGGLPCRALVDICYSRKYTRKQMQKQTKGKGGLFGYLGSSDLREIIKRIDEGDNYAKTVFEAMALQVAKDIGTLAPVINGKVDKIILTGGLAHSERFTDLIKKRVKFIAPISIMAGAREMKALASGILRVLNGQEEAYIL